MGGRMLAKQTIGAEMEQLQADVKNHDDMKRQLDACMSYQKHVAQEKELRARHIKVRHIPIGPCK